MINPKQFAFAMLFARWRRPCPYEDGYTILLPSPVDMPFLLRYALEGLGRVNTENCRQILVVPDGWGDGENSLGRVVAMFDDPRIELAEIRPIDSLVLRVMGKANGSATHWLSIVNGTTDARCGHVFLHDSDAFFLEVDGLERQYRECRDRGMYTLGVTARWDPMFTERGYSIPGTWESMYSTRWARSRSPYALKGGLRATPHGMGVFDTMLYPQYLDYPSGKVGVMADPPRFVHFNGTIVTYRAFRDRAGAPIIDEVFRVLLLALLEEQLPAEDGHPVVPTVAELARGLVDPEAPVTYRTKGTAAEYPTFRRLLDNLCEAPIFAGARADRIRESIRPFDEYFASQLAEASRPSSTDSAQVREPVRIRAHGLG
jgi:hypothetical protein